MSQKANKSPETHASRKLSALITSCVTGLKDSDPFYLVYLSPKSTSNCGFLSKSQFNLNSCPLAGSDNGLKTTCLVDRRVLTAWLSRHNRYPSHYGTSKRDPFCSGMATRYGMGFNCPFGKRKPIDDRIARQAIFENAFIYQTNRFQVQWTLTTLNSNFYYISWNTLIFMLNVGCRNGIGSHWASSGRTRSLCSRSHKK